MATVDEAVNANAGLFGGGAVVFRFRGVAAFDPVEAEKFEPFEEGLWSFAALLATFQSFKNASFKLGAGRFLLCGKGRVCEGQASAEGGTLFQKIASSFHGKTTLAPEHRITRRKPQIAKDLILRNLLLGSGA